MNVATLAIAQKMLNGTNDSHFKGKREFPYAPLGGRRFAQGLAPRVGGRRAGLAHSLLFTV